MQWLDRLTMRVRRLFHQDRETGLLDAELQFHLDQQIAENRLLGMEEREARLAALRSFGNPLVVRQQTHETWRWMGVERMLQDVRFALRQIARAPGFAVIAILILALGIGANNAVFTLTHALLLRNLPVARPEELVRLALEFPDDDARSKNVPLNLPFTEAIGSRARSFNGVFGWSVYDFVFKDGAEIHGIHGATVSGNTFEVLGLKPAAGRLLHAGDDRPGGGPDGWAAVISYRRWEENYNADPRVVGKHVTVTDHPVTIVGVAPEGFEGTLVAEHPDIYLPLEFDAALNGEEGLHAGMRLWLTTFARLKPGVNRRQAQAEMRVLLPGILDVVLPPQARHMPRAAQIQMDVDPASTGWSELRLQYTRPLLLLQLLVGAVLLICCANLSGLFLARASARQQEFAIRGALGAPRGRLVRQLLVESLLLAVPGAVLGVGLAWVAGPWILHALGNRQAETSLSARPDLAILAVTALCALLCAVLFGMAPAWTASRMSVEAGLRLNRRTSVGGAGVRRFFVPFQVALSLALVVVASLLGSTVVHLRTQDSGYKTKNVSFYIADFNRLPEKGDDLVAMYRRVAARLRTMPGVEDASVAEIPPLLGWQSWAVFEAAGAKTTSPTKEPNGSHVNRIGSRFLSAVGVPILLGRDLRDDVSDDGSCLLNQSGAAHFFPGESALGRSLRQTLNDPETFKETFTTCEVVGITGDSKYDSLHNDHPAIIYLPVTAQTEALSRLFFVIHGSSEQANSVAYKTALGEIAPASPETDPFQFQQQFNDSIAREQLLSVLSGFFAVLGLLLSAIGIYGLVAWTVNQRTMEIGLRMALGATKGRVFGLVMRQIAGVLVVGMIVGAVAAGFAAHGVRTFLYGVKAGNPWVFLGAAGLLGCFGLVAAAVPARKAVEIDPMVALRAE